MKFYHGSNNANLKELTTDEEQNTKTPMVQINVVDNSKLEKAMYESNNWL